jgi:hypothetical protein
MALCGILMVPSPLSTNRTLALRHTKARLHGTSIYGERLRGSTLTRAMSNMALFARPQISSRRLTRRDRCSYVCEETCLNPDGTVVGLYPDSRHPAHIGSKRGGFVRDGARSGACHFRVPRSGADSRADSKTCVDRWSRSTWVAATIAALQRCAKPSRFIWENQRSAQQGAEKCGSTVLAPFETALQGEASF